MALIQTTEQSDVDITLTDPRHKAFLQRWGLNAYNSYFNRDKKRKVVYIEPEWEELPPPPPLRPYKCRELDPTVVRTYDVFYDEYRDTDGNAVPVPPVMERRLVEPLENHYHNVPLEYIREHGALEFMLESQYCYSLYSLFYHSKVAEYQMEYIDKLKRERKIKI